MIAGQLEASIQESGANSSQTPGQPEGEAVLASGPCRVVVWLGRQARTELQFWSEMVAQRLTRLYQQMLRDGPARRVSRVAVGATMSEQR